LKTLFLIPARGGSKGVIGKNIKLLGNKPLIGYAIDAARELASDEDICVSSDDDAIIEAVTTYGLPVPFKRPEELAKDNSGMQGVMIHALNYYKALGRDYDLLVLLQPTSPFRTATQIKEAIDLFEKGLDMVVSVKVTDVNPYYLHYVENESGLIDKLLKGNFATRQELPVVYELNGAVYVIAPESIQKMPRSSFTKVKKYVMDSMSSLDIDTKLDWDVAEVIIKNH